MTVTSELSRVDYVGNDTADTYAYPFKVFADTELEVIRTTDLGESTTLVLDTDYTVTGAGSEDGGTIVLTDGELPTDYALAMLRRLPVTQLVDIKNLGGWFPATHEEVYDRLVMILQQQQEQIDRVLTFPAGADPDAVSFELPSPTSLYLLRWNAAADALENVSPADIVESAATGDFVVDTFIAGVDFTAGVTTALTLSEAPGSIDNTDVIFSGAGVAGAAAVARADYSLADDVLTFDAVIPVGVTLIEVKHAHSRLISMPASNSVDTAALQNGAVTTTKLDDEAVTTEKLDDAAITLPKLADGLLQSGRNFLVDGSMMLAGGADATMTAGDPAAYGKADHWKGLVTVSGTATLSRILTSLFGRTGRALRWTITAAGASVLTARAYVEAIDAAGLKNKTATLSVRAGHDAGANRNVTLNVYKANAVDDFSAVTAIRAGNPVAVVSGTDTLISERAIAMGDCSNGVMVEVVIASGIVTAKHFEITEAQLELGSQETEFEFQRYADVEARGSWYFERINGDPNSGGVLVDIEHGFCTGAGGASFVMHYRPKRALVTFTTFVRNGFYVIDYTGTTVQTTGGSGSASSASLGRRSCLLAVTVAAGLTAGYPCWLRTKDGSGCYFTVDARF